MSGHDELIIFAKAPMPGQVKTRLVPPLTYQQAAELYKTWARGIYRTAQQLLPDIELSVAYQSAPEIASPAWLNGKDGALNYFDQCNGDLGERISHGFDQAFKKSAKKVVVVGTDSPGLPASYLLQAFEMLDKNDMTLGPAYDGGYYLVGLKGQLRPGLFSGIDWSTVRVLSQTLAKAKGLGITVHLLPKYFDIDTADDLKRFQEGQHDSQKTYDMEEAL